VANVLADGRVATGSTGAGVLLHDLTERDIEAGYEVRRYPDSDYLDVIVPWDQVTTWRVACECGWTGAEREAFTSGRYGYRDCPEELGDEVFLPQWQSHVEPFEALFGLKALVEDLRGLETRIEDRVRLARIGGASWSQIGNAAGLTKQGAQQRWARLAP
jgi:hypothetical protein